MTIAVVEQKTGFIVDMRKGSVVATPGGEDDPPYYEMSDCQARTVVRVSTHTLGRPYPRVCNVPMYNGDYFTPIPKASLKRAGSVWLGGKTVYEPDGMDLYQFRYQHKHDYTFSLCQGEPLLAGGVPSIYDGEHLSELGSHYYPWIEDADSYKSFPAFLEPGESYQYCVIYEWHDARGRIHRSAPSPARQVIIQPGHDTVDLKVPTLQLTEKEDPESRQWTVEIVLFRTTKGGGSFFREQGVLNDKNVPYVTFTSTMGDLDLRENEILYTDGGVLPNFQPPAVRHMTHFDSRLWGISCDDPTLIFVSKLIQPGYDIPGFPLAFVIQNDVGGPHIALAALGSQLIAFKEEGVFSYAGSAPNDLGQQGTLSGPHVLSRHTGCINPKSVVVTPAGVAFQSRDTFWMVDRSHQITSIGGAVEDWVRDFPRCRASVIDQTREIVYFFMDTGPTGMSGGVVLCYHYILGAWTVWSVGLVEGADICYRPSLGRFELTMAADGYVRTLGDGYKDTGSPFGEYPSMIVSTPWLQFAGLAGFQRVKRFQLRGTRVSRHGLVVKVYHDFEATPVSTYTLTPAEVNALLNGNEEHLRFTVKQQKCKAIRVEVEAFAESPDNGGLVRWETIVFETAGKKGLYKLPWVATR